MVFANEPMLALFRAADLDQISARLFETRDPGAMRLADLSRSLPTDSGPRLERLRFFFGPLVETVTFLCRKSVIGREGPVLIAAALGARAPRHTVASPSRGRERAGGADKARCHASATRRPAARRDQKSRSRPGLATARACGFFGAPMPRTRSPRLRRRSPMSSALPPPISWAAISAMWRNISSKSRMVRSPGPLPNARRSAASRFYGRSPAPRRPSRSVSAPCRPSSPIAASTAIAASASSGSIA